MEEQLHSCLKELGRLGSIIEYASDNTSLERIWASRKGALNNIVKLTTGSRKPVGLIEDTVVPIDILGSHVDAILRQYASKNLDYVIYGHAGDGNIHTRPLVDLGSDSQIRLVELLAKSVFQHVAAARNSITGEHGDGIARTPYIEMLYGRRTAVIFRKVKELFDPLNTLNPGKKVPARVQ